MTETLHLSPAAEQAPVNDYSKADHYQVGQLVQISALLVGGMPPDPGLPGIVTGKMEIHYGHALQVTPLYGHYGTRYFCDGPPQQMGELELRLLSPAQGTVIVYTNPATAYTDYVTLFRLFVLSEHPMRKWCSFGAFVDHLEGGSTMEVGPIKLCLA